MPPRAARGRVSSAPSVTKGPSAARGLRERVQTRLHSEPEALLVKMSHFKAVQARPSNPRSWYERFINIECFRGTRSPRLLAGRPCGSRGAELLHVP